MASGSKRKRLNTLISNPYSTKKSKNVASSDDTQAPSQITGPSAVIAAPATSVDESSSSTSALATTIATPGTTTQVSVLSESSSQVNRLPIQSGAAYNARAPSVGAHLSGVVAALSLEESAFGIDTPNNATLESASQVPALAESSHQAPEILTGADGGFSKDANQLSIDMGNAVMMDNPTDVVVNIGSDQQTQAIKLLFEHTIRGTAHDSSARSPPPRCHLETRVENNEDLIAWFYNKDTQELLVWVYGLAEVGKSAIMQALADELAESLHLGASVFISRPNGRNSSRQLFLTIGYQLAEHIKDYCTFIAEKLARYPGLVDKGMEEQFKTFITEPFGERKIGASAKPWAVLLDGLDELDEHESQTEIIRLIANFVLEYPDAPLRWAIASRPEPHIIDTFDGEDAVRACWKMNVPVDHERVTYFLRDNLERIRKKFSRTVPKEWPSEDQLWELVNLASGLVIFASTVIRFIENPRYADPATRLNQILSALNGPAATSHTHPPAPLDALYASILSMIPHDVWPTTKRVLGALLFHNRFWDIGRHNTLGGIFIVLGLDLNIFDAVVNGCYSFVELPDPDDAYLFPPRFYHAPFGDYLLDPARSQNFCISMGDVKEDIFQSTLNVWQKFKADYSLIPGLTYEKRWLKYILSSGVLEQHARVSSHTFIKFIHATLVCFLVEKHDPKGVPCSSKEDQDQLFDILNDVVDIFSRAAYLHDAQTEDFWPWLFDVCEVYQDELVSRGTNFARRLETIKPLQAGPRLAHIQFIGSDKTQKTDIMSYTLESHQIIDQISHLKSHSPELPVLVFGSLGNHHLLLRHQVDAVDPQFHQEIQAPIFKYLYFPYSDLNSYHEAEHFLKTGFKTIQRKYSPLLPPTSWPSKEQFSKVADAVAHFLPFAHIALQFIEDPYFANPTTHLDQLLALIDGVDHTDDQPFIYVDALYTHILSSIPDGMWPATQQVLSALLCNITFPCYSFSSSENISRFFGLDLDVVYDSLDYCRLMVLFPPEVQDWDPVYLCDASFCQYLTDATRSKKFYVSTDYLLRALYNTWLDFKTQFPGIHAHEKWSHYCKSCPRAERMKIEDIHEALVLLTQYEPAELESKEIQDQVFHVLGQLDFAGVSMVRSNLPLFVIWLFAIWKMHHTELTSRGLFHAIEFQNLPVDYNPEEDVGGRLSHTLSRCVDNEMKTVVGMQPPADDPDDDPYDDSDSDDDSHLNEEELEREEYISGLRLLQQHRPQLQVLIGGIPGARFAIFEYEYTEGDLEVKHDSGHWKLEPGVRGYYVLPCPDDV